MSASEYLRRLRDLGARAHLEGGELKVSAPKGALDPETIRGLREHKEEIISILASLEAGSAEDTDPIPVVARGPDVEPIPLSSTQERLWFLDQLEPGLTAYNMWMGVRLIGELDRGALERTLTEIVRRHEVLRARYVAEPRNGDGKSGPRQEFAAPWKVSLEPLRPEQPLEDEQALDAWREKATGVLVDRCREPYDLARGPLFQAHLAEITPTEHVLLLGMHHSVSDGWSLGVLCEELVAHYEAFSRGTTPQRPELPIQYADYAAWQRGFVESEAYRRQLAFWTEKLGGDLPILEFPSDRPRPPVQTYGGDNERLAVSRERFDALAKLAAEEGATLFQALLALYQTLIRRFTGLDDILIGTPIANRERPELEGLVGFFSNTIVVRTDASGSPTFRELLRRTRDDCFAAYENQDLPFEAIVDELEPDRNLSHTPIFQTLFSLETTDSSHARAGGLELEFLDLTAKVARADVTFGAFLGEDRSFLWAEYRTDLFDAQTVQRLLACYDTLFADAVSHPDRSIDELELVPPDERRLVLEAWNDTRSCWPRESSIPREFEARAREHPERVAAVFAGGEGASAHEISYGELNARANRVAHALRERGVGPDTLVGLVAERNIEMLVGVLGILKAGGAYVPLDPGYPAERLGWMIEDAHLETLLVQPGLEDRLPVTNAALLELREATFADHPATDLPLVSGASNLAYVMFTSGSTGRPKGVCVEQRSVLRLVMDPNFCELGPEEVLLHFAPISFDASTLEVWGALLRGGRMVVYPPTEPSLEELGRVIREYGVTTAWLTAGLFHLMVDYQLGDLAGLRQLLAGGDVLSVPHVNRVLREAPGVRLINGYGPTENTTFTCCHDIRAAGEVTGSVPIGRPVSDTRVYLLDANLQPVPIGVPGDLFAAGDGVARGYLDRPELSAEKFLPDPFSDDPSARMYATGDGARWRADGTIEFLGRRDGQVKVRGYRIELGEIESVLGEHPAVADCVVVVREDQPGDKRIVAYTVGVDGEPDGAELKTWISERLPGYMVPAHFVALERFPLAPTGKVDRSALPSPNPAAEHEDTYTPPSNETQRRLVVIWQEVLGVDRIGIHDNFFELGGNSLLSTQAMARMREEFGDELALRMLFECPTVFEFARRVDHGADEIAGRSYEEIHDRCLIPLQPRGTRTPLFLVSGAHAHEDGFLRFVGSLLPYLGKDQPIYGFKARGLDGVTPPHASCEEMASDYVAELRELQPQGPYFLAGNCVGGIVAFEMALQLRDAGEEVAMLAMLDTTAPVDSYQEFVDRHYRFWKWERFAGHWRKWRELPPGEKIRYVTDRLQRKATRVVPLSEEARRKKHVEDVERGYSQILARYKPRIFDGRLTLILNEEFQRHMPDAGWTPFVSGELEIHVVPGDHVTRLTENAAPNAKLLEECIERAIEERDGAAESGRRGSR
ncbi:MAG TPA: non-ribosomal peptide synthetase [Planctomycetes bacterium]|nr:non-ribosomal peptide synthetase [Planctomycetota bacterium]